MRVLAVLLIVALNLSACAPALASLTPAQADVWRQHVDHIPVGAVVKIRTAPGQRFTGVLIGADDTGIRINPKTRIPEPIRHIPFDQIRQLEMVPLRDGSLGKVAGIAAATGAGAALGMLLLLVMIWDD
jgi:hypothetical protein